VNKRLQPDPRSSPNISRTHALGSIDLVPRDGSSVQTHLFDVDGDLSGRLSDIGMEKDLGPLLFLLNGTEHISNLLKRLDDTDLIVHRHDGDQTGFVRDSLPEDVQIDQTVALDGEVSHVESSFRQVSARIQDAFVFCSSGDDVITLVLVKPSDTLDQHVVGFRRSAGEDDILAAGSDEVRDLLQ
jgi:hypothetical protein